MLGAIDSLLSPAVAASVPDLVEKDSIEKAYRVSFFLQAVFNTFGLAVGLLSYQFFEIESVLSTGILLVSISLVLLFWFVRLKFDRPEKPEVNEPISNFKCFLKYKVETTIAIVSMISNMILVAFSSLIIPYHVGVVLQLDPVYVGLVELSLSIGAIFAVTVFQKRINRVVSSHNLVSLTNILLGMCLLLYVIFDQFIGWLIITCLVGTVVVTNNTIVETARSVAIPEKNRRKIQTIHFLCIQCGIPMGLVLSGLLLKFEIYDIFLFVSSMLMMLLSLIVFKSPDFKQLLNTSSYKRENLYEDIYGT